MLQAPDLPGRATPGNWFLFILDKSGVPSIAKTIQLQLGPATTAADLPNRDTNTPSPAPSQVSTAAQDVGVWTPAGSAGIVCIHTMLLPNSRLLCNERSHLPPYPDNPNTGGLVSTEIDLLNGADIKSYAPWTSKFTPRPISTNPLCSGHSHMANGSIIMFGGDAYARETSPGSGIRVPPDGRKAVRIYNPCPAGAPASCTGSWTDLPDMTTQRWYPSVATLSDGSHIIIGGSTDAIDYGNLQPINNPTYEYWPAKTGDWPKTLQILTWAF
eukprot:jgi/Hompol1/3697/HPOL_006729-RA